MKAALNLNNDISHDDSLRNYEVSFGSDFARNRIEVFYSVECGFSREFFKTDLWRLYNAFVSTGIASLILYPVGLDIETIIFAHKLRHLNNLQKRNLLFELCECTFANLELPKISNEKSDEVFFDIAKILCGHPEIVETLMIKVNGQILEEIPSLYSVSQALK